MVMKKWKSRVYGFNNKCNLKEIKYLVLILWTKKFNLVRDLRIVFRKSTFNIPEFINLCKKHKCYVLYYTLFTNKQKMYMGPIADYTSQKICGKIVNKICGRQKEIVTVVGCKKLQHVKSKVEFMNRRQFQSIILG